MPKRVPLMMEGSNRFFPFSFLLSSAKTSLAAAVLLDQLEVMDIDRTGLDLAGRNPHLSTAVIHSAFAIEAAINHIGVEHIPDWDKKEKKIFRLKNRLNAIASHFKTTIDCTTEPVKTLLDAYETRNNLAHGKPWRSEEVYLDDGETHPATHPDWLTRWHGNNEARNAYEAAITLIKALYKMADFMEHEIHSRGRGQFGTVQDHTVGPSCHWEKDTTLDQRPREKKKRALGGK